LSNIRIRLWFVPHTIYPYSLGLSILSLLPDKIEKKEFKLNLSKIVAAIMIILSFYWTYSFIEKKLQIYHFNVVVDNLHEKRHEYPLDILDSQPELIEEEVGKLKLFLDSSFQMLDSWEFRPNNSDKIADRMFSEIASMFVWIQYQQFLHWKKTGTIPEHLKDNALEGLTVELNEYICETLLQKKYEDLKKNLSVVKAFSAWFQMAPEWDWLAGNAMPMQDKYCREFNNLLIKIFYAFQSIPWTKQDYGYKSPKLPPTNLKYVSWEIEDDTVITFRFPKKKAGILSNSTLVMVYYGKPFNPNESGLNSWYTFKRIGGNLPQKYIPNWSVYPVNSPLMDDFPQDLGAYNPITDSKFYKLLQDFF